MSADKIEGLRYALKICAIEVRHNLDAARAAVGEDRLLFEAQAKGAATCAQYITQSIVIAGGTVEEEG